MHSPRDVGLPSANLEIKIVPSVPRRRSVLSARCRYARRLLLESGDGLQNENGAAQQQTSPKMFKRIHSFRNGVLLDVLVTLYAALIGVQRALSDSSLTRVWSVIQFTSQVLPPSFENDCSKWGESVAVPDQTNRTKITLPFNVSWPKNSPRPFLNSPICGGKMGPPLLLAQ